MTILEAAIGFVGMLYCAAYWVQSDVVYWLTGNDERIPTARLIRG